MMGKFYEQTTGIAITDEQIARMHRDAATVRTMLPAVWMIAHHEAGNDNTMPVAVAGMIWERHTSFLA